MSTSSPCATLAPRIEVAGWRAGAHSRIPWLLKCLVLALAGAYIAVFLGTAVLRLGYPYQLDMTEPAAVVEVQRVLDGQPLYQAPTLEYVPLIYGPVSFYLSALVASLTGPGYLPLRLVSLVASIGSLVVVFRLVERETGSRQAGLVTSGLLAAANPVVDTAMDIARVDALFTFFVLAATLMARVGSLRSGASRVWMLFGAGVLVGLAAFTKLPLAAAPIALGILIGLAVTVRRHTVAFFLGLCVCAGILLVPLHIQTGPWATWFLWDLPRHHGLGRQILGRFWAEDTLSRYFVTLLIGPVFLLASGLRGNRRTVLFYTPVIACLIGVSWASRAGGGGAPNVLLPAFAVFAILLGLGLHEGLRQFAGRSLRARTFQGYLLALCVLQFALFVYDPRVIVPYRLDRQSDQQLAAAVSSLQGPIFAPDFGGYTTPQQGQQVFLGAVSELVGTFGGGMTPEGSGWRAAVDAALRQHRFRYVLLETKDCCLKDMVLADGYIERGPLIRQESDFYAFKAAHTPEAQLYVAPNS